MRFQNKHMILLFQAAKFVNIVLLNDGKGLLRINGLASEAIVETLFKVIEASDERFFFFV